VPTVLAFGAVEIALAVLTSVNPHIRAARSIPKTLPV
jgi:hypothetical protein